MQKNKINLLKTICNSVAKKLGVLTLAFSLAVGGHVGGHVASAQQVPLAQQIRELWMKGERNLVRQLLDALTVEAAADYLETGARLETLVDAYGSLNRNLVSLRRRRDTAEQESMGQDELDLLDLLIRTCETMRRRVGWLEYGREKSGPFGQWVGERALGDEGTLQMLDQLPPADRYRLFERFQNLGDNWGSSDWVRENVAPWVAREREGLLAELNRELGVVEPVLNSELFSGVSREILERSINLGMLAAKNPEASGESLQFFGRYLVETYYRQMAGLGRLDEARQRMFPSMDGGFYGNRARQHADAVVSAYNLVPRERGRGPLAWLFDVVHGLFDHVGNLFGGFVSSK